MTAEQDRLVTENMGLVHACARRYMGRGIDYDDLYQSGCEGLVKAAAGYDGSRSVRFSTYAVPAILGEIRRLFRDGGTVKIAAGVVQRVGSVTVNGTPLKAGLWRAGATYSPETRTTPGITGEGFLYIPGDGTIIVVR